jgi:RNA-directed DNA polymerase
MTAVATRAGAPTHKEVEWHAIDWQQVHRNVRRLQARIVKATQEGRWGKVQALQRLLTHSFSGKALAVRRVTENRGKRTPGVDGEIWDTPRKKARGIQSLRQHGYRAQPLRRVYIAKSNGKKRPLGIPTMRDRAMQALYRLALDPIAETTGDPNSYGFRKERSTADAIAQCFNCLNRRVSSQWIWEADIKGCFDNISHEWLLENIPIDKAILTQWLKCGFIDKNAFHSTAQGTPQGGIISPVIANMTLDGLERLLHQAFPVAVRRKCRLKIHLVRYADDFVVIANSKELLLEEIKPLVERFLRERGLELSPEKTRLTHIEQGFDFLGQNVRKYGDKLLIKPSRKSIHKFLTKIRAIIKVNTHSTAGQLIIQLNPIIRGWANYHRHVVSKRVYKHVDDQIYRALRQWMKRRHLGKSNGWIVNKYYRRVNGRKWEFTGETMGKDGKLRTTRLFQAYRVYIERHVKVRAQANPYDPQWESYFERRLYHKMVDHLKERKVLLYLWQRQNGVCPICKEKITKQTSWEKHHIEWLVYGGQDTLDNLALLHPNCHRQVHSRGFSVAGAASFTGRLRGLSGLTGNCHEPF